MWKKILKIPMFGWKRSEFKCLEGIGQNLHVWKDKVRIPIIGRIRSEFKCLERYGQNSNV